MEIAGIPFETGRFGRRAVITTEWSPALTALLLENTVAELELNTGRGWPGSRLDFLSGLPALRSLIIMDPTGASATPIHALHDLRALKIFSPDRTALDFSAFPQLEECALQWRPRAKSLFACRGLRRLFLTRFKREDLSPLGDLTRLESLGIVNAPIRTLQGLSGLTNLRSLRLEGLRQLETLAGIEVMARLEKLTIQTCRALRSVDEIGALANLRVLALDNLGPIASLHPIRRLQTLETVRFDASTNVSDGDLTPLVDQRNLTHVSYKKRRHYSHEPEAFGASRSVESVRVMPDGERADYRSSR